MKRVPFVGPSGASLHHAAGKSGGTPVVTRSRLDSRAFSTHTARTLSGFAKLSLEQPYTMKTGAGQTGANQPK